MGSPPPSPHLKKPLINTQIRAKEIRLIDETGKQLGVVSLEKALQEAEGRNLDLIQVTEKVEPPVCKVMDYGKYLYQEKKKEKKQKPKGGEMKGIRLRYNISQHDLETRVRQTDKFLKHGDKIRIEMILRGREKAMAGFAKDKMYYFLEVLEKLTPYKIEREVKREARGLSMIIAKK